MRCVPLILMLTLILAAGCASTPPQPGGTVDSTSRDSLMGGGADEAFSQHYWDTDFQISENRIYSVEMMHQYETLTTDTRYLHVMVHDRQDKDIPGAGVHVTGFMPENPEATRFERKLRHDGFGLYTLVDPPVTKTGHWRLEVTIEHRFTEDTVVFDYNRVQPAPETAKAQQLQPGGTVAGRKGELMISRIAPSADVPYKREHKWVLEMRNADGELVEYGLLAMDARHVESGTRMSSVRMERLGQGLYSVGPVKFSRSGEWRVHMVLLSQDANDNVDFLVPVNM